MKYISLCPDYPQKLTEEITDWYWPTCFSCPFPYNLITDENYIISAIAVISGESNQSFCDLSDIPFIPFEFDDEGHRSAVCDVYLDLNFFIKKSTKPL